MNQVRDTRKLRNFWAYFILVMLGLTWRIAWLLQRGLERNALGEANNVAHAFARTGAIAEAHGPGTGVTAHLNPLMPVLAGVTYRIFGIESDVSLWLLSLIACGFLIGSASLLDRTLKAMCASRTHRILVFASLMLSPLYMSIEVISFRCWDGGLATLLTSTTLLLLVEADRMPSLTYRRSAVLGLSFALLLFVSPPLGLAAYLCGTILLFRKVTASEAVRHLVLGAAILALVLSPWTYRNYEVFGRFIPLRSNFGLEMSIGMHPAAISTENEESVFNARMNAIHPLRQPHNRAFLQKEGGEVVYASRLEYETLGWMGQNRLAAISLAIQHACQFYFPPQWFWVESSKSTAAKQASIWTISFLGFTGVILSFVSWRGPWVYVSSFATVTSIPYWVVQPVLRYSYLVYPFLLILMMKLVAPILKTAVLAFTKAIANMR